jgi:eukaryotic-like serine/threonine-protein kinase
MGSLRVAAGFRLGPYELGERLGAGGMAEVYVARRAGPRGFHKRFAVKRILPQLARDPRFVAMFCDEARICAALTHPNIVQIVDFGEHDGELFMAMEFVDGVSVAKLLRTVAARGQQFPLGAALFIAHEVLRALGFAHEACDESDRPLGIVHRDVSPGNILIGRAGEVKLADFGIVRSAFIDRRTNPGELKGKLGYMSPEQVIGSDVDSRSDTFAAGIVLAEMLLARPLFPGRNELDILTRIYEADLRVLDRNASTLPADVVATLRRALARGADDRFQSAHEFAEALRRVAGAARIPISDGELVPWLSSLGILPSQSGVREAPSGGLQELTLRPISVPRPAPVPIEQPVVVRMPEVAIPEYHVLSGGNVFGPLGLARVTELVATGKLESSVLISEDGVLFQPLREIEQLARLGQRRAFAFSEPPESAPEWRHPLERARLPALMLTLIRRRASGLLRARDGEREKRIYFADGAPCFVSSTEREELVGKRLVSSGLVGEVDVERALALACDRGQRRLGEVLVQHAVLRPTALLRALVEQLEARFTALFGWSGGTLAFHAGEQSGEEAIGLARPAGALVAEAVRAHYPDTELATLLAPLAARPIARGPLPAVELGLSPGEQRALERAPGSVSLEELVKKLSARGSAPRQEVQRAVLLGLSSGQLVMPGWPVPLA